MRKLGKDPSPFLVDRIGQCAVTRNNVVAEVPQTVFVHTQKTRFMNRGSASDLKSYTILRIITVVGHILLAGFVVFGKTRDVGRYKYAIAYLYRPDIKWREKVIVGGQKGVPDIYLRVTRACAMRLDQTAPAAQWLRAAFHPKSLLQMRRH